MKRATVGPPESLRDAPPVMDGVLTILASLFDSHATVADGFWVDFYCTMRPERSKRASSLAARTETALTRARSQRCPAGPCRPSPVI